MIGKFNKKSNIILDELDFQYLAYKLFPDNSFLLIGLTSAKLYSNIFDNIKNVLSAKISFFYEKQYKFKSYQINANKYIIINGKNIILIERNKKLLISKVYITN